jgi:hypothetical protein
MLKAKGRFVPQATNSGFNLNGKNIPQTRYITDELTDLRRGVACPKKRAETLPPLSFPPCSSLSQGHQTRDDRLENRGEYRFRPHLTRGCGPPFT